MKITIRGADLYSPPTDWLPDGGVIYRTGRRIRNRKRAGVNLTENEKRNILIGEVGEAAVMEDFKRRGFDVQFLSWQEFQSKHTNETATDLIVTKGDLTQRIQVKASEHGNRAIRNYNLPDYERSKVDYIIFVAVMELPDPLGGRCFECEITSQVMPRHIRQMSCWKKDSVGWQHEDNAKFIREWEIKSNRRGSKKILSTYDLWELPI